MRCCSGNAVTRRVLAQRVRRQTRVFARLVGDQMSRRTLLLYEVWVRGATDVLWAMLLWLPLLGQWLRPWLQRRMSCAFLGFEDVAQTRVGCLLHPRRRGCDVRREAAFGLLLGMGCGASDYFCLPAWRYLRATNAERARFLRETAGLDWHAYSRKTAGFGE